MINISDYSSIINPHPSNFFVNTVGFERLINDIIEKL